jgi:hypothetical protein
MRIPSGTTDQYIYFVAVDATDSTTRETGLTTFTVYRSRNGAAASAMTTPTINEVDATNMPGVYELLLDEDMTIGSGNDSEEMIFHITHTGMAPVSRSIELYRPKITVGNTLSVEEDGDLVAAIWDRVVSKANHNLASSAGRYLREIHQAVGSAVEGVVDNSLGDATTISFKTDLTAVDDFYNGQLLVFTTGALEGQARPILDYAQTDGLITFDEVLTSVPVDTVEFSITPLHVHSTSEIATEVRTEMDSNSTQLAAIVADTNELQTDDIPTLIGDLNDPTAAAVADAVWDEPKADHTTSTTFGSELQSVYHANIQLTIDAANTQDEYTVTWFKNSARVTSGITSPTIQVVARATGSNLVSSTSMTEIGSTGSYKYDEGSNRITNGEAVLVIATATIDGASRSFSKLLGRDASS